MQTKRKPMQFYAKKVKSQYDIFNTICLLKKRIWNGSFCVFEQCAFQIDVRWWKKKYICKLNDFSFEVKL